VYNSKIEPRDTRTAGRILIVLAVVLAVLLAGIKLKHDTEKDLLCGSAANVNGTQDCPSHTDLISWLVIPAFGIAVAVFAVGGYLNFLKETKPEPEQHAERLEFKPKFDESTLAEEEKIVWRKIVEAGGSIYQSDLVRETGFSRVKITRILDKLETASAIERKRRGMTNIVVAK